MVYQKTNWITGMVISSDGLNNLEEGVKSIDDNLNQVKKDNYLLEINKINSKIYDGTKKYDSGMSYITDISPFRNATLQQVWYDTVNHEYFIVQSDSQTKEGFVISRLASNGRYLDSMWFVGAGHGTQEIFKNIPKSDMSKHGDVYVHIRYFDGTSDIYTTKYVGNTTVNAKTDITKNTALLSGQTGQFAMFGNKIAQLGDDGNLYFWQTDYNKDTGMFTHQSDSMINYSYTNDLPSDAVAQGTALISKESVTGNYSDIGKYLVARLEGASNVRINLYFWEVDTFSSSVSYVGSIENLERSVIANQNKRGDWLGDFEPEGISTIEYELSDGVSTAGGFIIGINSGDFGYRSPYIYGVLNTLTLSQLISDAKANNHYLRTSYDSIVNTDSYLYNLIYNDQYYFNSASPKTYLDLPDFLKKSSINWDAFIINTKQTMQGWFLQTLKVVYPKELIAERYVKRATDSYGKEPVYNYTPWRVVSGTSSTGYSASFVPTSGKLTDFAPAGMKVYLTSTQLTNAPDVGNLFSIVPSGGGLLETGFLTGTTLIQTFISNTTPLKIARRKYNITPSVNGFDGEVSGTIGDWA